MSLFFFTSRLQLWMPVSEKAPFPYLLYLYLTWFIEISLGVHISVPKPYPPWPPLKNDLFPLPTMSQNLFMTPFLGVLLLLLLSYSFYSIFRFSFVFSPFSITFPLFSLPPSPCIFFPPNDIGWSAPPVGGVPIFQYIPVYPDVNWSQPQLFVCASSLAYYTNV